MKVVVGSTNPVKIKAVKLAFEKVWPDKKWEVIGIKTLSGVSDQPMSIEETFKGALTRAKSAVKSTKADYGIGIEGGVQKIGKYWIDGGIIVVIDKKGRIGVGTSAYVEVPPKIMRFLRQGRNLGSVNDIIFGIKNSKQEDGHFGLMTNGLITRTYGYRDGIIMALSRFIHPELFEE